MAEVTASYLNRATPGVHVTEIDAFGTGVVGVETAVPLFVGYTEFAGDPVSGTSMYDMPVQIASAADYAGYFGGAAPGGGFNLAAQIQLFYANGGANCYILSVGSYWRDRRPFSSPAPADWALDAIAADALVAGLAKAALFTGPTLLVVPEACLLDQAGYAQVIQAMLRQAGSLKDRMAILDLPGCIGAADIAALETCQQNLWNAVGPEIAHASYGAVYAPALVLPDGTIQPPSGAIAGIYTENDAMQGVWTAPANIPVAGIAGLRFNMNDAEQAGFNVPVNGQAINVLRVQPVRGAVVWGARTLDGNSNDYRYIQVRRTLIYVDQSIRQGLATFTFAANDGGTWQAVIGSISTFLLGLWQQGGLMGSKAADAFTVSCGIGTTMTELDVLNGYMIVSVNLQLAHPAEFVELSFTQKMQG
ncbi:phage tail sheath family protein [Sphingomonas kyeonggiensis]|uniref:Tail sheath protein C-terminal domain-containing protein n=1 Tax=Sphingomonas kyeonggiensis TaxID=1268553 RepID=A0A7W6JV28_9SPHN|nr:phage tail sheath C-terminal domain-containing protein [Sphingomonas kyeonggiensis]MBB4098975.1 hypothetical protein [Sphingomonas kyeonggiensis]